MFRVRKLLDWFWIVIELIFTPDRGDHPMAGKIEDGLEKAQKALVARDNSFVQTKEAVAAAVAALNEQTEADLANVTEDEAMASLKSFATSFDKNSDVNELLRLSQVLLETRGNRVIQVTEAEEAVTKKIQEAAEATTSDEDYDAAIVDLKDWASTYEKELDQS